MDEIQERTILMAARKLKSLGIEPFALLVRAANAEEKLAAYAHGHGIEVSSEGRARIPHEKLPEALREVPEALDAPSFLRHVMFLRYLAANPTESLHSAFTEEGLDFQYQTALPHPPSIPHADRDGASFWTLTKRSGDALKEAGDRERLEDTPLGASPNADLPRPEPPQAPTLEPILAILRRLGDVVAVPKVHRELLDQAKLNNAIALNDRRRVLMAERALTETESWVALAAERSNRAGGGESSADALRKFVSRTFRLAEDEPQRFKMAYSRGPISPALERALDEAEKKAEEKNE